MTALNGLMMFAVACAVLAFGILWSRLQRWTWEQVCKEKGHNWRHNADFDCLRCDRCGRFAA